MEGVQYHGGIFCTMGDTFGSGTNGGCSVISGISSALGRDAFATAEDFYYSEGYHQYCGEDTYRAGGICPHY